jgi:transposase-like protein
VRGKPHSEETKAAVMAALLAGQGVEETAQAYNLPKQTVSDWKAGLSAEEFGLIRTKKGERIEELLFRYLTSTLEALQKQTEVASDAAYLKQQPADSLAVLHGVMADKSIRLLEALHR